MESSFTAVLAGLPVGGVTFLSRETETSLLLPALLLSNRILGLEISYCSAAG
jgi:hypothetical protein